MLERENELSECRSALRRASAGQGGMLVIEGPPGIGKTELMAALRREAEAAGALTLHARALEIDAAVPFAAIRQLLEPVARGAVRESPDLFSGAAAPAARLFSTAATVAPGSDADQFAMSNAVYWVLATLADSAPLLVALDDAHWLDRPTLRLLEFLAARVEELQMLVVLATRPAHGDDERLLGRIVSDPRTHLVRPQPLSLAAVAQLAHERLGEPPEAVFTRACADVTGGNPFYLSELLRELVARRVPPTAASVPTARDIGPRTISLALRFRGSASAGMFTLARALAVLGDDSRLEDAAAITDLDQAQAAAAADALARESIIRQEPDLAFAHPILRTAIYTNLGSHERARAHRDAAGVLLARGARPERVAAHLMRADRAGLPWVVEALQQAAAAALGQGAPDLAASYLRRALAEPPPGEVVARVTLDLARAEAIAADPDAPRHFEEAFAAALDSVTRADVARQAGLILFQTGRADTAIGMLARAAEEADSDDPQRALELEAQLVSLAVYDPVAAAEHRGRLDRIPEDLTPNSPGARAMLCQLAYRRLWQASDAARAAALAQRAVASGQLLAEHGTESFELTSAALTLIFSDRIAPARELLDAGLQQARDRGSRHGFAHVCFLRSMLALHCGALRDVEADAQASLEIALPGGLAVGSMLNASMLVEAMVERGALGDATNVLGTVGLAQGDVPSPAPFNFVLCARGRLRVALVDVIGGLGDLHECGRRNALLGIRQPLFCSWRRDAALAHRARRELDVARSLADEELAAARDWGTPSTIGSALRLAGILTAGHEGLQMLWEAVDHLARSPAHLEYARASVELGAALRRANRRVEAREHLMRGLELADRCGASVLSQRARDELAILGLQPRRSRLTGMESLTPSERRAVQLAARGLGNVEIAQALFVTRKTVEKHLGNAYAKLGVHSRSGLRAHVEGGLLADFPTPVTSSWLRR